jgi:hypothetical protein
MAKTRKCKHCKDSFSVDSGIIVNMSFFCCYDHAIKYAITKSNLLKERAAKKKNAKQKREFKKSDIKTRKQAAKKACHAYIRERDKGLPCICCGRTINGVMHAVHFLESGNNPLIRYDEDNIHGQSAYCNTYKGGNSDDYEGRLREKIGDERVDALLSKKGVAIKRTTDDYIEIERYYKEKLKELLQFL